MYRMCNISVIIDDNEILSFPRLHYINQLELGAEHINNNKSANPEDIDFPILHHV